MTVEVMDNEVYVGEDDSVIEALELATYSKVNQQCCPMPRYLSPISFQQSDRIVCFVLPVLRFGALTLSHVTSDKSSIFLNTLAVTGPKLA